MFRFSFLDILWDSFPDWNTYLNWNNFNFVAGVKIFFNQIIFFFWSNRIFCYLTVLLWPVLFCEVSRFYADFACFFSRCSIFQLTLGEPAFPSVAWLLLCFLPCNSETVLFLVLSPIPSDRVPYRHDCSLFDFFPSSMLLLFLQLPPHSCSGVNTKASVVWRVLSASSILT